jgi:hypothetical protein
MPVFKRGFIDEQVERGLGIQIIWLGKDAYAVKAWMPCPLKRHVPS